MFLKSHFGTIITAILALVMGFIMAIAVILVDQLGLTWTVLFKLWAEIFFIVFVVSLFIPYNSWGDRFAQLLGLKPGTLSFKLVQAIIPSAILNTFNTLICSGQSIFYNAEIPQSIRMQTWINGWTHDWLIFFIISYLASFVAVWVGTKTATVILGKPASRSI
ncbi:hypothetical protein [Lactobacillus xylocopicola]|uniref:Uncharacterized protein n=1 Tax=Lactobacillus xylocopicola TaxID=2976676 RepID=A0ABM8BF45_9LACO|nr:hypothetical protein [Lactobacillus xylocopicola]BDR59877.1 hypothetical protein KIM322_01380 [Lactobacillus xylocopicola]